MPPATKPPLLQLAKDYLLDLLYPRRCGGCDQAGSWLCDTCHAAIRAVKPRWRCAECYIPLEQQRDQMLCPLRCQPTPLVAFLAAGEYTGPLREAVQNLKYEGWQALAPDLATLIAGAFHTAPRAWPAASRPHLLAVPLHPRRKRYRGFNQSELLAAQVAAKLGWPLLSGLERVVETRPQVEMEGPEARSRNVSNAFSWRGSTVPPGPIVLIDDVFTTGSTMRACAAALRSAGSGPVYGLALSGAGQG